MKKDIQDNHPGYPSSILTILIQICPNPDSQDLGINPDFSLQLLLLVPKLLLNAIIVRRI
jgi:hypothetical protein